MNRLEGKVAAVYSEPGTLGEAVAYALAAEGAEVVLGLFGWASGMGSGRDRTGRTLYRTGSAGRVEIVPSGRYGLAATRHLVAETVRLFAGLDIFVSLSPFIQPGTDDVSPKFVPSLTDTFLSLQPACDRMLRQEEGGAVILAPPFSPGDEHMMAVLEAGVRKRAGDLAPENIRFNAAPRSGLRLDGGEPGGPLGIPGEAEDVADAVAYLAAARYVTGHILPVDGGLSSVGPLYVESGEDVSLFLAM